MVFAPTPDEMYPDGFRTVVHVGGPLTEEFEAEERPAHFDGVATIVAKLFAIVAPDVAFFGEKDAQQLALIRRMTRDLDLPVEIAGVETVREPDGLAMSSRNAYLTPRSAPTRRTSTAPCSRGRAAALKPGGTTKDAVVTAAMVLAMPDRSLLSGEDRLRELKGQAPPSRRASTSSTSMSSTPTRSSRSVSSRRAPSSSPAGVSARVRLARQRPHHPRATPEGAYPATDATRRKEGPNGHSHRQRQAESDRARRAHARRHRNHRVLEHRRRRRRAHHRRGRRSPRSEPA